MSYVPPHLRGRSGGGDAPPRSNSSSSLDRGGGGGSFGRRNDSFDEYHRGDRRSGGYDDRRGGYDDRRSGYDDRRGGYGDRYDDRRDRGSYRDDRGSRNSGGGGFGRSGSQGSMHRDDSRSSISSLDSNMRGLTTNDAGKNPGEVVSKGPKSWEPSERVKAFTKEQVEEMRTRLNVTVDSKDPGEGWKTAPIESFVDMNLHINILKDIRDKEYEKPTPIQAQGVPVGLLGRDILGCAETGSGKTASFVLPMTQHVLNRLANGQSHKGAGPISFILAPTRELAQQIEAEVRAFTRSSKGVSATVIVGGTHMDKQRSDLRSGVEIVIATPGRLIDHLQQGNTTLSNGSFVVLDEADRMLDFGFEPQIRQILHSMRPDRQTLLFSATMPEEIEALAKEYLKDPVHITVGQVSTPTANVAQHLQKTTEMEKLDALLGLIIQEGEAAKKAGNSLPLTIIFVERKARCDEVAELLYEAGFGTAALHGGRSQHDREAALADFTRGTTPILVATDVASRGLDVKNVAHVINLDLPRALEDYVHRIGRTGRAGATGRATSFYTDRDSFIVAQIKKALAEIEAGNKFAFATGKAARAKEREEAKAWKEGKQHEVQDSDGLVKHKHMAMFSKPSNDDGEEQGHADEAWDD